MTIIWSGDDAKDLEIGLTSPSKVPYPGTGFLRVLCITIYDTCSSTVCIVLCHTHLRSVHHQERTTNCNGVNGFTGASRCVVLVVVCTSVYRIPGVFAKGRGVSEGDHRR